MKKLLTTCALVALGAVSSIAAGGDNEVITPSKIRKGQANSIYILTTESGETIKAYAWEEMGDRVRSIVESKKKATYTLGKTRKGAYKIIKAEVAGANNANKGFFTSSKVKKAQYESLYIFTTESGENIKAFAWGGMERRVKDIMKSELTAKYTLGKTKNGQNKIDKIALVD